MMWVKSEGPAPAETLGQGRIEQLVLRTRRQKGTSRRHVRIERPELRELRGWHSHDGAIAVTIAAEAVVDNGGRHLMDGEGRNSQATTILRISANLVQRNGPHTYYTDTLLWTIRAKESCLRTNIPTQKGYENNSHDCQAPDSPHFLRAEAARAALVDG